MDLVGPDGLLNQLTRNVLETALQAEMSEHLGYDKYDAVTSCKAAYEAKFGKAVAKITDDLGVFRAKPRRPRS